MIFMFLNPGAVDSAAYLYDGQSTVQVLLLLVALVAVPWMLVPKPLILNNRYKAAQVGRRGAAAGRAAGYGGGLGGRACVGREVEERAC